jgi:Sec7-like guanine-nucleotide exchange factor
VLLNTIGEHLIPQQEWFLHLVIKSCESGVIGWNIEDWATSGDTFSNDELLLNTKTDNPARGGKGVLVGEIRELYLETVLQLCRKPSFFTDLYLNHDGNMNSKSHLFDKLLRFFAKFSFPDITPGGALTNSTHQNLCIDGLLIFLRNIVERRNQTPAIPEIIREPVEHITDPLANNDAPYSPETVTTRRMRKRVFLEGAEKFNESVKSGISYFQKHGFLPDPLTPKAMADFLCHTPNLSKVKIGEYIAKPQNIDTLANFAKLYDFHGKRIDEAMRVFLERFRIPGESQQIERIMNAFSHQYFASIADDESRQINTEDDTGVLAFSIIMLNTDQHNRQVRRRMTFEDYTRNVRGLNSGKNFAPAYLKGIFDAIKKNEIVLAEEHGGELGFNFQWREILKKQNSFSLIINRDTNVYDKDLISAVWGPILAALFYKLDNAEDNLALQKAVVGIQHCAIVSSHYELPQIIDYIIISMSRISGLGKEGKMPPEEDCVSRLQDLPSGFDVMPASMKRKDGKLDRWVIEVGRNYRAQVAAVFMFNLAADFADDIHEGWKNIIHCIHNMYIHQILPPSLLVSPDYIKGNVTIPRIPTAKPEASASPKRENTGIFFSTLQQLLSISSAGDDDVYDFDTTGWNEARMVQSIHGCHIDELLGNTRYTSSNN